MNFYKSFEYVKYLLKADFETSFKMFSKMREREYLLLENENKNKHFQMYLKQNINLSFNQYYEQIKMQSENNKMTYNDKVSEEERIKEKYKNITI